MAPTLSYCVVNTNGREHLLACLAAIERHHPEGVEAEVLVLDNASEDGSVEAVRSRGDVAARSAPETGAAGGGGDPEAARSRNSDEGAGGEPEIVSRGAAGPLRLISLERRAGKAENDSTLLREARGEYCLLLNEDSELRPGAAAALVAALDAEPRAAAAGAQLLDSAGDPVPCAWRFPGLGTALIGALFLHRRLTVQSGGGGRRQDVVGSHHPGANGGQQQRVERGDGTARTVDWAQSSALLVRRQAAAEVGYLDPRFFVYYDECDFARRLRDAGWRTLFVPAAEAVHHDQLSTDLAAGLPRIVEFHRNRDLYMRKHHSRPAALAVRLLTAWSYALRALAATVLPRHPARVYLAHARHALFPSHGEGLRDRSQPTPTERFPTE